MHCYSIILPCFFLVVSVGMQTHTHTQKMSKTAHYCNQVMHKEIDQAIKSGDQIYYKLQAEN